ncbi:BZ3500_MvSof-1268-A1-R1_Chr1-3g02128 [Microbotryum saponariae]|uniref:BZ3500_MvSof-1268-A1-R1_Chr1-3g02128 protein n=1 Tax=Microbotryum saponariae TaxID=289078 RepID=A0A2X0LHD6_9BASI|nr:BZ3500_MvSof-1268-A1-R1_Chr1-3g02128 [Microbotryum saponariae]SCZ95463.1 BZ3501_MvSof-1269-A2-R1_Chr1-3g01730 [Microbotryum saponariae]
MPRARLYLGAFLTLFTIGTVGIARGTFNMMRVRFDS